MSGVLKNYRYFVHPNWRFSVMYIDVCVKHREFVTSMNCRHLRFRQPLCMTFASSSKFPDSYNPRDVEEGLTEFWEQEGVGAPKPHSDPTKLFSMLLPPPNVTGTLHLGHTLTATIQDILARWHRMRGKEVVWLPGLDHAGIATQMAVEKKLWKENGLTRHAIGRHGFEKEVWKWKEEKAAIIIKQLKYLGTTMDWSRETFTLDPKLCTAVDEAFIRLFDAGLIYRSNSIVNWSCVLNSAISDIEVEHKEILGRTLLDIPGYSQPVEFGVLTYFPLRKEGSDDEIVVATTRIETVFGDTAVAVHPEDKRYETFHGTEVWHPIRKTNVPVICDESVDPEFGTGAVKITPAHSQTDFKIAKKHNLPFVNIFHENGTLNENCGAYCDMKRFDARRQLTNEIVENGLLYKQHELSMKVPMCSRTGDVVEFLLTPQWFLNCSEMGETAKSAVQNGDLEIIPSSHERTWFRWLEDLRPWCISRQLWWGHQIPAYLCKIEGTGKEIYVAARNTKDAKLKACQAWNLNELSVKEISVQQETDVLDTWFSSALLPFSALGWPAQTADLKKFYPLSIMETGHDILFFWVARMVMLGTYLTGKLPFKKVLLHGVICDAYGRKMSKSVGNVINPEDVTKGVSLETLAEKAKKSEASGVLSPAELKKTLSSQKKYFPNGIPECGSDALRFTLCSQNISNFDVTFDVTLCHKNRHFCNKLWQLCKYIRQSHQSVFTSDVTQEVHHLSKLDTWIISRLAFLVVEVDRSLTSYRFHTATDALKNFLYYELCDTYLEATKPVIRRNDSASVCAVKTLVQCAEVGLCLLNPFMPFVTERLYQHLPLLSNQPRAKTLALVSYPTPQQWVPYRNEDLDREMDDVIAVVSAIRHMKSTYAITGKDKPEVFLVPCDNEAGHKCCGNLDTVSTLARVSKLDVFEDVPKDLKVNSVTERVGTLCDVYLLLQEKDLEKEFNDKVKQYKTLVRDLEKLQKAISKPHYKSRVSVDVQKKHLEKITFMEAKMKNIEESELFARIKDQFKK